jgi:hypothetical protein
VFAREPLYFAGINNRFLAHGRGAPLAPIFRASGVTIAGSAHRSRELVAIVQSHNDMRRRSALARLRIGESGRKRALRRSRIFLRATLLPLATSAIALFFCRLWSGRCFRGACQNESREAADDGTRQRIEAFRVKSSGYEFLF